MEKSGVVRATLGRGRRLSKGSWAWVETSQVVYELIDSFYRWMMRVNIKATNIVSDSTILYLSVLHKREENFAFNHTILDKIYSNCTQAAIESCFDIKITSCDCGKITSYFFLFFLLVPRLNISKIKYTLYCLTFRCYVVIFYWLMLFRVFNNNTDFANITII